MLFKSKKALPTLRLYSKGTLLYDGLLKDIPLKESILLEKSNAFFDDPEPCHIHRSAVRIRLITEIQTELQKCPTPCTPGSLLLTYADYESIDLAELSQ